MLKEKREMYFKPALLLVTLLLHQLTMLSLLCQSDVASINNILKYRGFIEYKVT